jgi:multidrug efflux pump subunit AcrB
VWQWVFLGAIALVLLVSVALVGIGGVKVKMLPFDNKSEFQVVLDMPEGTALEETGRVLDELAAQIVKLPEVTDYQVYVGTSAPINFNGLVRQYYLRSGHELGDIQVNLVDKHHRDRKSHEIALAVRPALAEIGRRHGAAVKIVEVPPGPPVQAPLVAEVYGPFYGGQQKLAGEIRRVFESNPDIVDVDDSLEAPNPRQVVRIDRQKAALLGVSQAEAVQVLSAGLAGLDATYVQIGRENYPVPVRLELDVPEKADLSSVLSLQVRSRGGAGVPLSEISLVESRPWDSAIYHKDLLPVAFVTADAVGKTDSPLYGMFEIVGALKHDPPTADGLEQYFFSPPADPYRPSLKWDGEWQITFETFRDMGLAYSVGLILIYLLVVAQFGSYMVPLVIMAPIPLTIIGVMPGHALLGAQFTATSMIGMIALAGIIVRNSILLVDFINIEIAQGRPLADAVVRAAAVRARPIALTAVAAMTGAFFIIDDPIFNGLAVSLIFGILVSTVLTLVLIPILYFSYRNRAEIAA